MRTEWQLFVKTEDVWDAMKELCENAKKEILCEQFIIEIDGETGRKFLDILIKKAKKGVKVKILCDMVGSVGLFTTPSAQEELSSAGVEIAFWNPVKLWRIDTILSWFFRDHRKILVVDGETGMVGGVGLRDDMREWRDTHVKVSGPIVSEMKQSFSDMWELAHERRLLKRIRKHKYLTKGFEFVTNAPTRRAHFLRNATIAAIRNARRFVHITNSYFIPDRRLKRALRLAAKRGVEVKVLVPKVSNHVWVDRAGQATFAELLAARVDIFTYTGKMLHAKTMVVDGEWATVGSMNLDYLSMSLNYEANVVSTDPVFAETVNAFFEEDLEQADRVIEWAWRKRGLKRRALEKVASLFQKML